METLDELIANTEGYEQIGNEGSIQREFNTEYGKLIVRAFPSSYRDTKGRWYDTHRVIITRRYEDIVDLKASVVAKVDDIAKTLEPKSLVITMWPEGDFVGARKRVELSDLNLPPDYYEVNLGVLDDLGNSMRNANEALREIQRIRRENNSDKNLKRNPGRYNW